MFQSLWLNKISVIALRSIPAFVQNDKQKPQRGK
jgi:hypothetical protein